MALMEHRESNSFGTFELRRVPCTLGVFHEIADGTLGR